MFLLVFAGGKRRGGEIFKISIFDTWQFAVEELLHSAEPPRSPENAGNVGVFLIYFAALSLVFELKQNLEDQPYTEKNSILLVLFQWIIKQDYKKI